MIKKKTQIVTIKDIASAAGVYPSAVSNVLNNKNHTRISEERREHIRKIAEEMGYKPNFQAKCLRKGKKPAVGIFLPEWRDILLLEFMQGLSDGANRLDIPLSFHFGLTQESYSEFIDSMTAYSNTGIISYVPYWMKDYSEISEKISTYINAGGKVIAINSQIPWIDKVLTLNMDEIHGGKLAAEYLLAKNCKSYVSLSFENKINSMRIESFQKELHKNNKKFTSYEFPSTGDFNYDDLYRQIACLILQNPEVPFGIFAASNSFCTNSINYLNDKGLKIGRDFEFISYDYEAKYGDYFPVARIIQPFYNLGKLTMEKLDSLLTGASELSEILKPEISISNKSANRII